MKPFIEDRNLNKYEFAILNRKQRVRFAQKFSKLDKADLETVEDVFYELFLLNHPNLTKEDYEDILDFNDERYGFEALYELMGTILSDVFTRVGGNTLQVHPYLQMKQEQETVSEEISQEAVVEAPQVQEEEPVVPTINPIYY